MTNPDTERGWKNIIDGVEYIDSFFDPDWLLKLYNKIKSDKFEFRGVSAEPDGTGLNQFWFLDLLEGKKYNKDVEHIGSHFPSKIVRAYVNYQTFGQHGDFHEDDGSLTYLIYINPEWSYDDGGGTEFQTLDMTSVVSYPVFNRIIKFNAKFNHRALPNIRTNAFRYTVAFKTDEAMSEDRS